MAERLIIDAAPTIKDLTQLLGSLDQIDAALLDTSKSFAKVGDAAKRAGADVQASFKIGAAQGVASAIDGLQKEFDDLSKSADTLKKALKGATDPAAVKLYASSIAQLELGMADLEKVGKSAGVNLRANNKEAGLGKQVFSEFFGAFTKASLIVAAIEAVRRFVVNAVNLAAETAKATRQFENFLGSTEAAAGAVADLTALADKKLLNTQDVLEAGRGLLAFGEGVDNLVPVLGRLADVSAATGKNFNELVTIYGKARTAGVLYAEDINQLVDAGIPIIQEFAKQMGVSNDQVKKLASEGKISFEELQLAMFNLTAEGGKFANAAETQANELSGLWASLTAEIRPAVNAVGEFFKTSAEGFVSLALEGVQQLKSLFGVEPPKLSGELLDREELRQDRALYEKELAEREKLEEEARKRRNELRKKGDADRTKQIQEEEKRRAALRVQVIADETEREIAAENLRFQTLQAELKKLFKGRAELNGLLEQAEKQHQQNLAEIYLDELESFRDARDKYEAEQEARLKDAEANQKERERILREGAETERDLRNASIDIGAARAEAYLLRLKEQGASEAEIKRAQAELDLEIQAARLRSEIEFQQTLLAITDAGNTKQVEQIQKNIELLQTKLGNITFKIDNPETGQKFSIFSLLGLDPNDPNFDRDVQAIKKAADEAVSAILSIADARLQAAEAAVEAANRELEAAEQKTEAAEQALEEEKDLRDQGYAHNVSDAEQNLALAEQFEAQKKAQRDKALQDQRKAQQAQMILDALLQSSNIITSASNIIKGFSAIPIVGGPLGIAAAATMVAGFVAAKIKAIQAVRAQQFRTGGSGYVGSDGVIVGPSHEGGGVQVPEYEGGEFFASDGKRFAVVNKKMTSKHYDLLKAINADDREGIARHAHLLSDFAPTFDIPAESMGGGIEIDRDEVARRVFGDGDSVSPAEIALAENEQLRRNNQLLEKMLAVMTKDANKGEWSADGKTFRKQGLTKRYLN